jgi:hypothetical protein
MRHLSVVHKAKIGKAVRKLTDEQVREARRLLEEYPAREVALKFRVHPATLYGIKSGRRYGHVPDQPPTEEPT